MSPITAQDLSKALETGAFLKAAIAGASRIAVTATVTAVASMGPE